MRDSEGPRRVMHEAIEGGLSQDEGLPETTMLMGWIVLAEWMDGEGNRWLSRISADASGGKGAPAWQQQGYLFNGLHDWPPDEE